MREILLSMLAEEKKLNQKLTRLANEGNMEFLKTNEEQQDLKMKMENKLNMLGIKYEVISTKRRDIVQLAEKEEVKESESVDA